MKSAKDKRNKKIQKLKKVHILPHLLLMFFSSLVFVGVVFVFGLAYCSFLIQGKFDAGHQQALGFVQLFERENAQNIEKLAWETRESDTINPFYIYDKEGNFVLSSEETEIDRNQLFTFIDYEECPVFIKDDDTLGAQANEDFGLIFKVVPDFIEGVFQGRGYLQYDHWDEELLTVPCYVQVPIFDDTYSALYNVNITFVVRDMLYLVIILIFSVLLSGVPLFLYIVTLIVSISSQRKNAKILYLDLITGDKNWIYFGQQVEHRLKVNKRKLKRPYVMVSLRLDKFQSYCLCHGTKEGEQLLEKMSVVLRKSIRSKEVVARYAEAEFGLLLLFNDEKSLMTRLETMKQNIFAISESHKIEISCGICPAGMEQEMDPLYNNASIARKAIAPENLAKVAWYNETLKSDQLWAHHVEEQMERALANGEFKVYLQPKYNATTKTLGGAEALIRWISPTEGIIGPNRFIPIFEKNGFITKIDDFMLESVARLQARWIQEGRRIVPISVNVSRAHFARPDLAEHICRVVESTGAPKECIELELTESAFFQDKEMLINTVKKLRDYGFEVSMDDFGADYSSLNSLKDMPLDVLKIDAGFFRGKEENEARGSVIVAEVIQLAKNLDMKIVAEGIENANQVEFLADKGCDLIQGFYFAKPMPVEEFEKLEPKKEEVLPKEKGEIIRPEENDRNGEKEMFEAVYYTVKRIDGDYAYLVKKDEDSQEEKCVARALLPAEISEGSNLVYEMMEYSMV